MAICSQQKMYPRHQFIITRDHVQSSPLRLTGIVKVYDHIRTSTPSSVATEQISSWLLTIRTGKLLLNNVLLNRPASGPC